MDWLNEYMDVMAKLVGDHGGVIEKFTGDGITALFGVPLARADDAQFWDDARNAVNCALAMRTGLSGLNSKWQSDGQPRIGIRIGINTGPLVVGSLGSADRMQYTAIGDTVNTAARLESLGKEAAPIDNDCPILIGEPTAKYIASEFELRFLGPFSLKGKDQVVPVYQVVGPNVIASDARSC